MMNRVIMVLLLLVFYSCDNDKKKTLSQRKEDLQVFKNSDSLLLSELSSQKILSKNPSGMIDSTAKAELKPRQIINGRIIVSLPVGFRLMEKQVADLKYPTVENRFNEIYTDKYAEINVAFNHTFNKTASGDLPKIMESIVNEFQQIPEINLIEHKVEKVNGNTFFLIEFTSEAIDARIYNIMIGTVLDGRMLIGTFNCTDKHRSRWESIGKEIINSIKLNENI